MTRPTPEQILDEFERIAPNKCNVLMTRAHAVRQMRKRNGRIAVVFSFPNDGFRSGILSPADIRKLVKIFRTLRPEEKIRYRSMLLT